MRRFHVHLHVEDLARSIGFCSKLFAAEPARREIDYAKWMLDDPPVNFAISTRGEPGIDHLLRRHWRGWAGCSCASCSPPTPGHLLGRLIGT